MTAYIISALVLGFALRESYIQGWRRGRDALRREPRPPVQLRLVRDPEARERLP